MTPENIRFYAAGQVIAALALVEASNLPGAKSVLALVQQYVNYEKTVAPPLVKQVVADALEDPSDTARLRKLEEWFCHPLNTVIEQANG